MTDKFFKFLKVAGWIVIIVLVILYFDGRENKRVKKKYDMVFKLESVSETLENLESDSDYAFNSDDVDCMQEILYSVSERCKEMKKAVDEVCDYIRPAE